ncbi:hypothetical protein FACS1894130_03280 [Spirochaetia bacterium]|nr:hypothetical protein FACS1894130_03280 [Spirochaetia bacterium]
MNILELQDELVRTEFPYLLPDHDPDIERYFLLRNAGRNMDALNLYQFRLKPRYPNDEFRALLMRCFRSRSPAYRELLSRAYRALGMRSLERMKRLITYVADRVDAYNPRDVYSTIKAAESIKQVLPRERYEAMALLERLLRYAQVLNLRPQSVDKGTELLRAYLNDSISIVEAERRRRDNAQLQTISQERQRLAQADWETYGGQKGEGSGDSIGLSSVAFSPAELAQIEIPKAIARLEDKTLAYCAKYWYHIDDPAFDRILFLYSRKYGAKNYDVYQIIRRGRLGKKRDDEILSAVMASLVTGYYYSVLGDKYIQFRWIAIKNSLQPPNQPGHAAKAKARSVPGDTTAGSEVRPVSAPKLAPRPVPPPVAATPKVTPSPTPSAAAPAPKVAPRPVPPPAAAPVKKNHGSVSQRLQELSGRSYDVYQDQFLAKARPAIKKVLGARHGLFVSLSGQVEELVFNFLKAHYSDSYMNWEESEERTTLAKLGFELESLIPVIDECYKML